MIRRTIVLALRSIWAQKLRSGLTMLGVIIGVGAIITLVALARGATTTVAARIESLGSNLIVIQVGPSSATPPSDSAAAADFSLTPQQALALGQVRGIAADAPVIAGGGTLQVGSRAQSAGVVGTNAAYQGVLNYQVAAGRFLSRLDVEQGQNVMVLGSAEARALFGPLDPVGATVALDGVPFRVIGVLAAKGTVFGQNQDDFVAIPWTVARALFGVSAIQSVYLSAAPGADMTAVVTRVDRLLLTWLQSAANFNVATQAEILNALGSVTGILTTLLAGIAGISLVVGGIGIMNIMLVSVTERTREIGIRKAIGASRAIILLQFLIEALTLSGLGGLLGIVVGNVASRILASIIHIQVTFSPRTAALAFLFSLAIGLGFGLWPANRAAGLHPVDALRME